MLTKVQTTIKSIVEELKLKTLNYETVEFLTSIAQISKTFNVLDTIHENITYLKPLVDEEKYQIIDKFEDEIINTYLKLIKSEELFTKEALENYKTVKYEFRTELSRKLNLIMIYLTDKSKLIFKDYTKFEPMDLKKYNIIQSMLYLPKFNIVNEPPPTALSLSLKQNTNAIITNIFPLYNETVASNFGPISTITEGLSKSVIKRFKNIKTVESLPSLPFEITSPCDDIFISMGKYYKTTYGDNNLLFSGNNCNSSTFADIECDRVRSNNKIYNNVVDLNRSINEKELISIVLDHFSKVEKKYDTIEDQFETITPDNETNYLKTALKKYYINECLVDMVKNKTGKSAYDELLLIYINHSYTIQKKLYTYIRDAIKAKGKPDGVLVDSIREYIKDEPALIPMDRMIYIMLNSRG
jgi:hypothetical protein